MSWECFVTAFGERNPWQRIRRDVGDVLFTTFKTSKPLTSMLGVCPQNATE